MEKGYWLSNNGIAQPYIKSKSTLNHNKIASIHAQKSPNWGRVILNYTVDHRHDPKFERCILTLKRGFRVSKCWELLHCKMKIDGMIIGNIRELVQLMKMSMSENGSRTSKRSELWIPRSLAFSRACGQVVSQGLDEKECDLVAQKAISGPGNNG